MSPARDNAQAEALRIAHAWLLLQGWSFTPADVGKRARQILDALDADPKP